VIAIGCKTVKGAGLKKIGNVNLHEDYRGKRVRKGRAGVAVGEGKGVQTVNVGRKTPKARRCTGNQN